MDKIEITYFYKLKVILSGLDMKGILSGLQLLVILNGLGMTIFFYEISPIADCFDL